MQKPADGVTAEEFWDDTYRARDQIWSGNPNPVLVELVGGRKPGSALDLGCGEGADSIWLARNGWDVTGVDVAQVALDRAAEHAARSDLTGRVDWQRHDLTATFPEGTYDLVSAQFLHSPMEFPREEILRRAARAVAPNGLLLVVGHAAFPPWSRTQDPDEARAHDHEHDPTFHFPTASEVVDALDLPAGAWTTEVADAREREATGPAGQVAQLVDTVVMVRRLT